MMGSLFTFELPSDRSEWLIAYWGLVGAVVLSAILVTLWRRLPTRGADGIRLDLYQTAALREHASAAIDTAVVRLVLLGALTTKDFGNRSLQVCGPLPEGSHSVEVAVHQSVLNHGQSRIV
jgi:uncharacterized protein (TIGR04222 family)